MRENDMRELQFERRVLTVDPGLTPEACQNLESCRNGDFDVTEGRVVKHTHRYWEPAVGKCQCGTEVTLSGNTNVCQRCGRAYNAWGAKAAPRHQWGSETGEPPADVARWMR